MYSPLEPFAISIFWPLFLFDFDLSLTTAFLYLCIIFSILAYWQYLSLMNIQFFSNTFAICVRAVYSFVSSLIRQQTGHKFNNLAVLFTTVFMFILCSNLLGLFPFGYTITAHVIITFTMALSFNIGFFIWGIQNEGFGFFKLFVPKDAPLLFKPLIAVIELISYLLRTFSLSIRLFANMMAGHTLLHILASFCFVAGFIFSIIPWLLVVAVVCLEIAIAFIQAYVFVILLCIYLNDVFSAGKH